MTGTKQNGVLSPRPLKLGDDTPMKTLRIVDCKDQIMICPELDSEPEPVEVEPGQGILFQTPNSRRA